jgi:deazaflavin-dependent oxidoreductase (nitroreductase family)
MEGDGMTLARLLRSLTRLRRIQPQVGRLHALVLRRARGRLRRSRLLAAGQPVLALTTVGRRSGKPRSTVVAYLDHGAGYAAAALNLGSDRHPAWCLNLMSEPRAWVEVGGERRAVRARRASGAEAEQLWRSYIARLPAIGNALRLAGREVPMFVLEPLGEREPVLERAAS